MQHKAERIRDGKGGGTGLEEGACCDWRRYLGSARNLSLLATALDEWLYLQSQQQDRPWLQIESCRGRYQVRHTHTLTHFAAAWLARRGRGRAKKGRWGYLPM